jgi:hypothetical protein
MADSGSGSSPAGSNNLPISGRVRMVVNTVFFASPVAREFSTGEIRPIRNTDFVAEYQDQPTHRSIEYELFSAWRKPADRGKPQWEGEENRSVTARLFPPQARGHL